MPAPIVIDVGITDPQRELAGALVEACTQAATSAGTDCRLVRDAPSGPYSAIAIVTWEEGDRARVEVGVRREPASEWRTRELTFQSADAEIERYRSVGFVIGSLATTARDASTVKSSTPAPAPPEPPPAPPTPPPPPPPAVSREPPPAPASTAPRRGWVGVVGTLGGGLDRGPARLGGQLDVGVRVVTHLYVLISGGASTRARDDSGFAPEWLDAGVGLGVVIGSEGFAHLDLHTQLIAEQFTARVQTDVQSAESSRAVLGGRTGVVGVVPLGEVFELVLGGVATFRPATRIHVGGVADGATRNAELGALAGLRLEL